MEDTEAAPSTPKKARSAKSAGLSAESLAKKHKSSKKKHLPLPEEDEGEQQDEQSSVERKLDFEKEDGLPDDAMDEFLEADDLATIATVKRPAAAAAAAADGAEGDYDGILEKRKPYAKGVKAKALSSPEPDDDEDDEKKENKDQEEQTEKASDKDASEDDDDDDEPAAAAPPAPPKRMNLMPSKPAGLMAASTKIPDDADFRNPNMTTHYWSVINRANAYYSELDPTLDFRLTESKPDGKKFYAVESTRTQMVWSYETKRFMPAAFKKATVWGPFGTGRYVRAWPYGNRDPLPKSKFPPPEPNSMRYQFTMTNHSWSDLTAKQKNNVGEVNQDVDVFMSQWVRGGFDQWGLHAALKFPNMFKIKRAAIRTKILNDFKLLNTQYETQMEAVEQYKEEIKKYKEDLAAWKAVKKNKDPQPQKPEKPSTPVKPNTSEKKLDELERAEFLKSGINSSVRGNDYDKFDHMDFQAPLLLPLTKKEQDALKLWKATGGKEGSFPATPPDPFFADAWRNPKPWEDKVKKTVSDGYPRKYNDVLMSAAVTLEEAAEIKKQRDAECDRLGKPREKLVMCPRRLIPRKDRFLISSDIYAERWGWDFIDSPVASQWRWIVQEILWLGESGKLDETKEPLPRNEVCPTSYYLVAQKYTRTKENFNPATADNWGAAVAAGVDQEDSFDPGFD